MICRKCCKELPKEKMYFAKKAQKSSTICKECHEGLLPPEEQRYNPNPKGHPLFYNQIFGKIAGNTYL